MTYRNKLNSILMFLDSLPTRLKSDGYWTDENILKELEGVIAELGHFPTGQELNNIGRFDLNAAISPKWWNK